MHNYCSQRTQQLLQGPCTVSLSLLLLVVVQLLSHVQLFATPWTAAGQATLSSTVSWSLLNFMFSELVMPSNHLILAAPFSFCLHSFPASGCFPISRLFALFIFWSTEFLLPPLLRHLENSCLLKRLSLLEALDRRMGWYRPLVRPRRLGAQTWSGQNWRQGKQFLLPKKMC